MRNVYTGINTQCKGTMQYIQKGDAARESASPEGQAGASNFHNGKVSKKIANQYNRVFKKFRERPMTMKECSVETSLDRGNVCWYVRTMRLNGIIQCIGRCLCPITGFRAKIWTTDPKRFLPVPVQLELFSNEEMGLIGSGKEACHE